MPTFSKRHYEFIAASINRMGGKEFREVVAKHLAEDFKADNGRFDYDRFIKAAVNNPKDS